MYNAERKQTVHLDTIYENTVLGKEEVKPKDKSTKKKKGIKFKLTEFIQECFEF
jgi:hypothetical protein